MNKITGAHRNPAGYLLAGLRSQPTSPGSQSFHLNRKISNKVGWF